MLRSAGRFALLASLAAVAGCAPQASPPPPYCPLGTGSVTAVYTLYFGKGIAGRGDLTQDEWQRFVDSTVVAELPDGFTAWDASGAWLDPATHTTGQEQSKVLVTALAPGDAGLAAVNRVRAAYRTQFRQRSVGMTVAPSCGDFSANNP